MSKRSAEATLYGLALGDTLGWPVEFLSLDKTHILYGPDGIRGLPDPAQCTHDTQMTVALAEALIQAGRSDGDSPLQIVAERLVERSNSPEDTRT